MKREDWQRVYQPRQGALEARVGQTLRMLDTQTNERIWAMKKTMALALAAVLLLRWLLFGRRRRYGSRRRGGYSGGRYSGRRRR